jgi:hypothetical protein
MGGDFWSVLSATFGISQLSSMYLGEACWILHSHA